MQGFTVYNKLISCVISSVIQVNQSLVLSCLFSRLSLRLQGESDAQTASPFPQRNLGLLCRQPTAAGTDPQAVQHKAQTSRSRQALLARGAVKVFTVTSALV